MRRARVPSRSDRGGWPLLTNSTLHVFPGNPLASVHDCVLMDTRTTALKMGAMYI